MKLGLAGRISAVALVALIALCAACSNDNCFENKNSLPLAGFYSSANVPQKISLDSISIYGIGAPGNALLLDTTSGVNQVYLPFRIDQPQTRYVIDYCQKELRGIRDTITFRYEIVPYFVSSACGAIYKYDMTEIATTHFFIDSVTCPGRVIDNANTENLRIYFRVETESGT